MSCPNCMNASGLCVECERAYFPERHYQFLGNLSAVDPAYSRSMECHDCEVRWIGCWDNFQCPKCGEGELPTKGKIWT